jgi:hypothetical protein
VPPPGVGEPDVTEPNAIRNSTTTASSTAITPSTNRADHPNSWVFAGNASVMTTAVKFATARIAVTSTPVICPLSRSASSCAVVVHRNRQPVVTEEQDADVS